MVLEFRSMTDWCCCLGSMARTSDEDTYTQIPQMLPRSLISAVVYQMEDSHQQRSEEGVGSSDTGVTSSDCERPACQKWVLGTNWGPLERAEEKSQRYVNYTYAQKSLSELVTTINIFDERELESDDSMMAIIISRNQKEPFKCEDIQCPSDAC
ncbi:hypothetical protein STEG23_017458 [Scotinomys teguina]